MNRKQFLRTVVFGSTAISLPFSLYKRKHPNLNILVLGGTGFVGPAIVRELIKNGHQVTLFNRGKTDPNLFPGIELLKGNRYPERGKGLSALKTNRTWDAVVDTWAQEPGCVNATCKLLSNRVKSYVYISSIATYSNYRKVGITEQDNLVNAQEYVESFDSELGYSLRKRASEQAVENIFDSQGIILRCSSILGYDGGKKDPTSQSAAAYWGFRFLFNTPVLVPDDSSAVMQYIDVKDIAKFLNTSVERNLSGPFNLVGPEEPLSLLHFLETFNKKSYTSSEIIKISPNFLNRQKVRPFVDIPFWIPIEDDPEPGFYQISNKRALNNGLTYRSLSNTINDIFTSLRDQSPDSVSTGLNRTQEIELIEMWKEFSE